MPGCICKDVEIHTALLVGEHAPVDHAVAVAAQKMRERDPVRSGRGARIHGNNRVNQSLVAGKRSERDRKENQSGDDQNRRDEDEERTSLQNSVPIESHPLFAFVLDVFSLFDIGEGELRWKQSLKRALLYRKWHPLANRAKFAK